MIQKNHRNGPQSMLRLFLLNWLLSLNLEFFDHLTLNGVCVSVRAVYCVYSR